MVCYTHNVAIFIVILAGTVRYQSARQFNLYIVLVAGLQEAFHLYKIVVGLVKVLIALLVAQQRLLRILAGKEVGGLDDGLLHVLAAFVGRDVDIADGDALAAAAHLHLMVVLQVDVQFRAGG